MVNLHLPMLSNNYVLTTPINQVPIVVALIKTQPMTSLHCCMEIGEFVINLSLFQSGQCIPSRSADMALEAFACVLSCMALMHRLRSLARCGRLVLAC